MNGNSKPEKVNSFIRRAVRQAIAETAINQPDSAVWLRQNREWIASQIADSITWDHYRMKELADIMAWKKPSV